MKRLINCLGKVTGKLVTKEDADHLVQSARALEAEGLTPIQAERQAVQDALDQALNNGENILSQIRGQRPAAYSQALNFWDKETIRKAGMIPPPLPGFVTQAGYAPRRAATTPAAPVPAEEIVAVHNAPDSTGSTVNAVHGDLGGTNSYSFSIFPDLSDTVPGKIITAEQVNKFAAKAQAAGIDVSSPNISIGTWYDRETDTTFLDIAFTTRDRAEAIRLGNEFNQKAVFDLSVYQDIPLGGTGIAPENLPSIEERLRVLFSPAYDVGRYAEPTTQAQGAPSAPGASAPAQEAVPGGAQGGQPAVGGVHEEVPPSEHVAPPEIPAAPISDAAQEVVNSLPEEQRNAAQKAFARDDRDPLADAQRSRGEPVAKRKGQPVTPEKNTKLVEELSKYGVFDKSPEQVLQNIASDPKAPRWKRLLADVFAQLGLGDGVSFRVVNTPNATWPALYVFNKETGKAEILINLSYKGDLASRILHELMHHGTLLKLTGMESDLTPAELDAKRALQEIFEDIRSRPEFKGLYGASSLQEFVSEIFANDELRAKLDTIRPDGKVSFLQRIIDAISKMLIGDRAAIMRPGSLLETAIKEALKVAGSPRVETSPDNVAAMQERRTRAAEWANEHPNFQEEISNIVAPMADNMGITEADQIEEELDHEAAFYSEDERKAIEADVDKMAKGINATEAEIREIKKNIGAYIKYYRASHPAKTGWANSEIKPIGLEEKGGLKRVKANKRIPLGIIFDVKFKDNPYTFARDAAKKLIPRFLDRKGTVANPEWAKRRAELGNEMFDDLQGIMARRNAGGKEGRIAQVIVDQINWYRDMMTHLRTNFGSMSDYVADVIAGFSPITDVPGNWRNFVDYFGHVMKGDYDEAFRKFDEYISADPENRSAGTYKKEFPPEKFPQLWPRKLHKKDQPLFGANTGNALMAGLDLWRAVQTGTAPKARNFGLNLIGQSLKATIDRWAARYLQRMHAPTWRLPLKTEGAVTGAHMTGENVELVSGDFGMGQDVFEDVATRLQASGIPEFKEVTAADLQAILWFAEKAIWEMRDWTPIMGAGSSMNALAQATAAQRYEIGVKPGKASVKDKALMGEVIGLRDKINKESHVMGTKMVPSVNIHEGKESKTFDGDLITHPEYDPGNTILHVAEAAAKLGKNAAHISRVIVNPYEVNPNRTPGLHVFFRGRVGDAEIKRVLDKLKTVGITNGITLSVDPRVRPEIIKSLDPEMGANQYNGLRIQFIPEYGAAGEMTSDQIEDAFMGVKVVLAKDASIAESRVLYYDTLVLKKGTDYDNGGKLTKNASEGRAKVWTERARREGTAAANRRDNARKAIADRKQQDSELELRIKGEEQERIAKFEESQRRIQPANRANDGGVDPPVVAAMQYEDQTEPVRDPHGGRASLVRSMVNALTNASRDRGGIEVPESEQEVRGAPGAGGGAATGRKGSAPLWRPFGATFRAREAGLYQRIESAAALIRGANPEDPENPKDPAKYQNSQALLDYLSGKQEPDGPELKAEIAELRKEIPVVSASAFENRHLDSGSEADVFHDANGGVVYKTFNAKDGKLGGYVPGQIRLDRGGDVRISMGEKPTVTDLLSRMERANSHGALTPHELTAVTPEGQLVFASPYVEGRGVTQKNLPAALARAGVHFLSDLGATSGVAKLDDGRWVVYDDLHPGNVRTMPGGRVEVIDANNRELDQYEIDDLHKLGKMPLEKPPKAAARAAKRVQKYDNAIVVAPMVETYHGTPHEWAPEVKVRFYDGTEVWFNADSVNRGGLPEGAKIIERAPAGRVREEKVGEGEGHAAYGWGVLYSAQERKVAERYREQLSEEEGKWLVDGEDIDRTQAVKGNDYVDLHKALTMVADEQDIDETIREFHSMTSSDEYGQRYARMAALLEKFRDRLQFRKGGAGNVYTVQLDVNDPELLDWFKPMKDQMWVFDKVAEKFGVTREEAQKAYEENERLAKEAERLEEENAPKEEISGAGKRWHEHSKQPATVLGGMLRKVMNYTGEKFYKGLYDYSGNKTKKDASMFLKSAGIPGIVFLDQQSRKQVRVDEISGGRWSVAFAQIGKPFEERIFETKEEADRFAEEIEGRGTNNYVMFDPEKIKVVAKNGEVVRTVADDLPAPSENVVEPVTVAAMAEEEVRDDRDLSVAPMAATGTNRRYPWPWQKKPQAVAGYKPGGLLTPHAQLSKEVGNFVQERERREKAVAYRAEAMTKDLERALKAGYGKQGPDKTQIRDVQMALGNLENRLTQEQYNESLRYANLAERRSFIEAARHESVEAARDRQRTALSNLPDIVRKYVDKLRKQLDLEAKELLKDPGIDTELRARVDSELGVFLHSNSYQHFESNVWGEHIKSDDPEAKRIRSAAEILFKNEVIGEKAHEYQVANPGTSDAVALAHAAALPNIGRMVENRLAAYLRKDANEVTRMHLLSGKITIPESGKLLSLNRENLPQEVRELWGQWTDPKINFVRTYTILANHNASIRMQHSIVENGQKNSYIWKPDPADPNALPPADLVPLGKAGDEGPMADAYGPQDLKDGLAKYHKPEVQNFLVDINRWSLMSKTVGNVASAVHNFFGNIAFSIANGNLLWAVTLAPKTLISSFFGSFAVAGARATGMGGPALQETAAEMIELGVFDSDIAIGTLKKMARAAQAGILVEKKLGPAAGLQAAGRVLRTGAVKTGAAFKETYQAADNWWKYFNFRIELAKQQWFHSRDASPPSLEEMKRAAADQVMNTLPSYSRVPELVRRGLTESPFKYTGAFFTFQTEAARTAINNGTTAWAELTGGNAKQKVFGGYRIAGMMAMAAMPYLFSKLSKLMFGYDDDDEEALRNSLPEYQKNASLLFMFPKDKNGLGYVDVSWLNPYGLFHSSYIAGRRAYSQGKGLPTAAATGALQLTQPLMTIQPGLATLMGAIINRDFTRGMKQIYNPQDTFMNKAKDVGDWFAQGFAPGTALNTYKAIQSARGIKEKSGREPDPLQDITAGLAGLPRVSTLELDRAMAAHVGTYEKSTGDAKALLNELITTKATVAPGEIKAAYRQAQAQTLQHNIDINRAYEGLKKLGMDEDDARSAMEIGFGSEIMKSGLGREKINDIISGRFRRVEISKKMEDQAQENGRLDEYLDALDEAEPFVYVEDL